MAKKIIYQVVVVNSHFDVVSKVKEFFSTKEKAIERIEKEAQDFVKYGAEVKGVKEVDIHKWQSVEICGEWKTCTLVNKLKTHMENLAFDNYMGYIEYELD